MVCFLVLYHLKYFNMYFFFGFSFCNFFHILEGYTTNRGYSHIISTYYTLNYLFLEIISFHDGHLYMSTWLGCSIQLFHQILIWVTVKVFSNCDNIYSQLTLSKGLSYP